MEPVSKHFSLVKIKADESFNHPGTICRTRGADRNTYSILGINPPKTGGGLKFSLNTEIGQHGTF
jgi:hypothetical protein